MTYPGTWTGALGQLTRTWNKKCCFVKAKHALTLCTLSSRWCWWAQSPTPGVWVCSSPLHLRSPSPSPSAEPSPHRTRRAARGPRSPSLQSHETTGSTACLSEDEPSVTTIHLVWPLVWITKRLTLAWNGNFKRTWLFICFWKKSLYVHLFD